MKRRKEWKTYKGIDSSVYNTKLARRLHKISLRVMRIAKHYGVAHVDIVVISNYASVRANEEHGWAKTTVVDDYIFTVQED